MPKNLTKSKKKKQKMLAWLVIAITAVNFLLVTGFLVYLYFWVKAH
ncbi:hypothetical protein KY347_07225 [Candidatus Woesearchaeota archaeon]|nr:hypothetical protein [Candidatus Woesearchaeota archaeon]